MRSIPKGILGVSLVLATMSHAGAESGRCLRAEVTLPMVFPDGSEHPPGRLTLCVDDYSPVASYHKVSVNGLPVGFLFSQRRIPERQNLTEPIVLFRKTGDGKLRLTGYLWPSGKTTVSYLLQGEPWDADAQTRVRATETFLPPPASTKTDNPGS